MTRRMQIAGSATVTTEELGDTKELLRRNRIPPSQGSSVGQLQLLALSAAQDCLSSVALDDDVRLRTAVLVGTTGSTALQRRNAVRVASALAPAWDAQRADGVADAVVDAACAVFGAGPHDKIGEMASSVPSRIAIAHRLAGRVLALDAHETTAALALWHARSCLAGADSAVLVVLADEDESPAARAAWEAKTGLPGEPRPGAAVAVLLRPEGADPGAGGAVVDDVRLVRRRGHGAHRHPAPEPHDLDGWLTGVVPAGGGITLYGDAFAQAAARSEVLGHARHVPTGRGGPGSVRVTDALLDVLDAARACGPGRRSVTLAGSVAGTTAAVTLRPAAPDSPRAPAPDGPADGAPARREIAVAGAGARFAGRRGLDEFRELSGRGEPVFTELGDTVPERLRSDGRIRLGRTYCTRGARTVPPDTPVGGGPLRRAALDPAHLAAVETCAEAVHRAGGTPAGHGLVVVATPLGTPSGRLCEAASDGTAAALEEIGERVGAGPETVRRVRAWLAGLAPEGGRVSEHSVDGRHSGSIAAVVADELGLDAVPVAVEAACASTLAALDVAVAALRAGDVDYALVAGVEFPTSSRDLVLCSALGMLSQSTITPFGDAADGFLPGDGAGALLLVPAGDRARTRIAGTGGSCDAHSMLAPSADGQRSAMERALTDAAVRPSGIAYVETHGTGTPRGDAIELESVRGAYGDGPITLSAIKSLLGHTFAAAGMAGLLRAVTALEDGVLPPSAGLSGDDTRRLAEAGFALPSEPAPIGPGPGERATRAAVSSFGTGGINYHVVVERSTA